jgi:hypothetical protein
MVHPTLQHVIVDGSNIATEGRDLPSLAQLDEAVQAFIREYEPEIVTVVVDATFPNRIARNERKLFEDAIMAGEVITPPAGAIGRGDAFVLQIADRAGATVLSNDSFQEFHGSYDWLFEEGRLIGGKPVPHVGWVFMPRTPVRGPASRRSVSAAKHAEVEPKVAKTASKVAKAASKVAKAVPSPGETTPDGQGRTKRPTRGGKKARSAAPKDPVVAVESPAEISTETARSSAGDAAATPPTPPPVTPAAYNEALPFIEFVGDHPVGSEVDAVVEHFGSHGAYLRIGDVRAYVPLKNLADPAPRSVREVLRVGESRRFVVASVDPPRRGVDLAIPGVLSLPRVAAANVTKRAAAKEKSAPKKAGAKKTPAKKAARTKKRGGG